MLLYNSFYDLLERFSIMTVDGKLTDGEALELLKNTTTEPLFNELINYIKTPKKAPNIADIETLEKYIKAGFELYPCVNKGGKYIPILLNGRYSLYESEEAREKKEHHGIKDINLLRELVSHKKGIKDEYNTMQYIDLFRVFPLNNKFIIIDIDIHEGKENGFIEWRNYLKSRHLEGVEHLQDLKKFPCYVSSANGGVHLYFKFPYSIPEKIKDLKKSVEISSLHHGETAGGSYREQSKNKYYTLHGNFEDAPILPLQIYKDMQGLPQEPAPTKKREYNGTPQGKTSGAKWNKSLEGIIEKARAKGESNHFFIYHVCNYARKAIEAGDADYTKEEIKTALFMLPEVIQHERKDPGDTMGVINSFNWR